MNKVKPVLWYMVIKDMMEHILCSYLCIQSCHQQKPNDLSSLYLLMQSA